MNGGPPRDGFRHEALLYEGYGGFVKDVGEFIRLGVAQGEALLVVVTPDKSDLLRAHLGPVADSVRFEDMAEVGANPARILPVWSDFVAEQTGAGREFRGVGEPVWGPRSAEELAECARHEALLNLAFANGSSWRLACPYDRATLDQSVVDEARRNHPIISIDGSQEVSEPFRGMDAAKEPFDEPLPDPRGPTRTLWFGDVRDVRRVREFVRELAVAAGLEHGRVEDLVLAADEIAANSLRHGGGQGVLRVWKQEHALICEVSDRGDLDEPLAGRQRPEANRASGMGLWIANHVCDLVQLRSTPEGSIVRLHMRL